VSKNQKNLITGVIVLVVVLVIKWLWLPDGIFGLFED
jgi:hypothetical protein